MTAPTDTSGHETTRPPLTAWHRELALLQRRRGRSGLDDSERDRLGRLHDTCLDEPHLGEEGQITCLLTRPFSRTLAVPEYYQYTCMHVYGWFLDRYPGDPVHGVLLAAHATVADLAGMERAGWPTTDRPDHIAERIEGLDGLLAALGDVRIDHATGLRVRDVLDRAAADPVLSRRLEVLAECTRFPRSAKHEEHVFLRSVQVCEMLFFLIRRLAVEVTVSHGEFPARCAGLLDLAGDCAQLLNEVFQVLLTLSPEGFMTFRDETGAASAVQSLNYHAMEIAVYGYDPRKAPVFASVEHLTAFNDAGVREHRSLSTATAGTADAALAAGWHRLDRTLSRWRGGHYRFARTYLPSGTKGSGDTEGAAYVRKFVRKDLCLAGIDPFGGLPLLSGFLYC
ncbi:hypothetical protein [Streptomyces pactum]|uniref:hypothetical protein n=1 Tax=Streptomyces pactum TaxID=68249 RepID=UPI0027DD0F5F|nr:hypothetical protein [Streptomyces pactum]